MRNAKARVFVLGQPAATNQHPSHDASPLVLIAYNFLQGLQQTCFPMQAGKCMECELGYLYPCVM